MKDKIKRKGSETCPGYTERICLLLGPYGICLAGENDSRDASHPIQQRNRWL